MSARPHSPLFDTLERFEAHAWRCSPAYAARVRRHLIDRLVSIGVEPPAISLSELVQLEEPELPEIDELPEAFVESVPSERGFLVINEGATDELVVPLQEVLCIGRGGQNDLKLQDNKVSRYHCRLVCESEDRWVVEDLASANGTMVNGELFRSESRRLFGGEEVLVGNTFLRFRLFDGE